MSVSQWKCVDCSAEHNRNEKSARNHLLAWTNSQREAEINYKYKSNKAKAKKSTKTASETKLS